MKSRWPHRGKLANYTFFVLESILESLNKVVKFLGI